MPFTVTVERTPRYILFAVEGIGSLKNYFDLIEQARTETPSDRLVLVDLTRVVGRLHVSDQMFIGDTVVDKLSHLERLALVVSDNPGSYAGEKAAAAKGFPLRTFGTRADAEAWLLGG